MDAPPAQQETHRPLLRVDQTQGQEAARHVLLPVDDTDVGRSCFKTDILWVLPLRGLTLRVLVLPVNAGFGGCYTMGSGECVPHRGRISPSSRDT